MPGPDTIAADAAYSPMFPLAKGETPWRKIADGGATRVPFGDGHLLKVDPQAIETLTREAFRDIAHYLRPGHLKQLASILDDPEASANDKFVALDLLKNANISAGGVLPMCQDTGTAIVMAKKGERVFTGADDEAAISRGVKRTYTETSLRYSQMAALDMYKEVNTGDNLPAQIDIYSVPGEEYHFLFIAKGGGSANKTFLYQETKAVLNPDALMKFIDTKMRTLGTALPPGDRHRRHLGRADAEDGEARLGQISRRAADQGRQDRACLPRRRDRAEGARAFSPDGHRRAVRR
jgi:fumarate hydratase class I